MGLMNTRGLADNLPYGCSKTASKNPESGRFLQTNVGLTVSLHNQLSLTVFCTTLSQPS